MMMMMMMIFITTGRDDIGHERSYRIMGVVPFIPFFVY